MTWVLSSTVMAVLVTAIHASFGMENDVDGRVSAFGRPGHDEKGYSELRTLGGG